jgi:hypothetical protein
MILLDHIVHVRRATTLATEAKIAGLFQFRYGCRIRWMPIDVDYARADPTSLRNCKLEKAFSRDQIAIWQE